MMAPIQRDPHDLAGEYVLGTLDQAERARVDAALADDSQLRAAVRAWEQRLLPLTGMVDPVTPPAALWARIERSLTPAPTAAAATPAPRWWNSVNLWRALAVGGLGAAAIMAAVLAPRLRMAPEADVMVVLAAPQSFKPGWVIERIDARRLRLVPLGATAVPAGKSLQFWTKGDSWSAPVSLGLVTSGQPLEVSLERLPSMEPNQLFEITLEPKDGSPIGRPTGPILFIGRAVAI